MARKLEVEIVGDARSLNRALGSAESSTKGLGKRFGQLGKTAAYVGGAAAIGAVSAAVGDVVGDMLAGQKATAQTNAVLRSTGKIAGVTADHVQNLATKIAMKSGMDDEAIQSGENLLLTFTNIRNEAGKGNNIFDQTTSIMADMSAALGQDASSSAIQLGKALNDPIKGVTALQRVGVSFTAAQKAQIKALEDSGHHLEAQKLILRELNKEFAGSAEAAGKTLPGQLSIAKMAFENWSESMITKAMPAIQDFIETAKKHIPEAKAVLVDIATWINDNVVPILKDLGSVAGQAFRGIAKVLQQNWPNPIKTILDAFIAIVKVAAKVAIPLLKVSMTILITEIRIALGVLRTIITVIGDVASATQTAYHTMKGVIDSTGDAVTTGIKELGRALDTVQNLLKWIRDTGASVFKTAWAAIQKPLHAMNDAVRALGGALDSVKGAFDWLIRNAKRIGGFFGGLAGAVKGAAGRVPTGDAIRSNGAPGGVVTRSAAATGTAWGVDRGLWDEIALGQADGLVVTSGFRPGAHTKHGTLSDHALHKAVDMSGSASSMATFFKQLIGRPGIKQAFYDPLGSIFGGQLSSYREGGHSDHVHVAEYDRGGILPPGLTLAINRTGRNEQVIGPGGAGHTFVFNFPNYIGSKQELVNMLREEADRFGARNGRLAFG